MENETNSVKRIKSKIIGTAKSAVYAVVCAGLISVFVLTSCAGGTGSAQNAQEAADPNALQTRQLYAMDTYMSLTAYGEGAVAALDEAEAEIRRLDAMLAAEQPESEIGRVNAGGGGSISAETGQLIERAIEMYEVTNGAFDITIYPVKKLWGFADGDYRVPTGDQIDEALTLVGSGMLDLSIRDDGSGAQIAFQKEGMEIDLGGIAKGYTSARVTQILKAHGAGGMVNLGGNVQACGPKPDGSNWRVAVRKPESPEQDAAPWVDESTPQGKKLAKVDYLGIVETSDKAVVTSGGYERYFEQNGRIYHHILDPKTGAPSNSDLVSATVVSGDGTLADGLSTSLFVMGSEKAAELWRGHRDAFDMILMDRQGNLYVTEGLEDSFTSELDIHWIRAE